MILPGQSEGVNRSIGAKNNLGSLIKPSVPIAKGGKPKGKTCTIKPAEGDENGKDKPGIETKEDDGARGCLANDGSEWALCTYADGTSTGQCAAAAAGSFGGVTILDGNFARVVFTRQFS